MGNRYRQIVIEERCEIARLQAEGKSVRQIAAAVDSSPSTVSRELKPMDRRQATSRATPSSRRERGAGVVHGWIEMPRCVSGYSCVLVWAGLLSRCPGGLRLRLASDSSRTRVSIGSSMLRLRAPKTTLGGTICRVGSPSVVGGGAAVAVLPLTSPTGVRLMSTRRLQKSARVWVIGRRTRCSFGLTDRRC